MPKIHIGASIWIFCTDVQASCTFSIRTRLGYSFQTKILIFGIRSTHRFEFKLGNNKIEICDEFKYLGVIFTKTRTFAKAIKHNVDHANKALHLLYKKIHNLHIPIDLQLQLFDHTIVPILLYGCEVWGFQNTKLIETVHTKFLKILPNYVKAHHYICYMQSLVGRH